MTKIERDAFRRIAGFTFREFWMGVQYLGIPEKIAEAVWRKAQGKEGGK